jgi:hypothetical protein
MIFLKDAVITTIALCKRGKNKLRTLYKSADASLEVQTLVKASTEQGELLAVVYAPDRPDDDGDAMTAKEIRKAAHRAMREGIELDIEHDGRTLSRDEAWVAESFIIAKGDERFRDWQDYQGNPVGDLTGAWASLTRLESDELRAAYRRGEFDGVSMFGTAAVEQRKSQSAANVVRRLEGATKEIDMNEEELKAILKAHSTELLAAVDAKLATVAKSADAEGTEDNTDETESDPRPVFKGNVSDSEALRAYQSELAAWELNQRVQKGEITADELATLVKSASEGEPSDEEAGIVAEDSAEVKSLKRRLFKAQKVSNVSKSADEPEGESDEFDAEKAHEFGLSIAKAMSGPSTPGSFKVVPKTD